MALECERALTFSEVIEVIKPDPQVEKIKEQNRIILGALGHLLKPEERKKLGLKLPIYSEEQIDALLEDQDAVPEQKAIEDKTENEGVQA